MSLLIKNGNVVTKDKVIKADILAENGIIVKIGNIDAGAEKIIDAAGCYVTAGFIDMHTHLRDPGQEYKEDIISGTAAAVKGGFTTVCCMPNTKPVLDNAALIRYVIEKAEKSGLCRVLPIGAITKESLGAELAEMAFMAKSGAVAFSDDGRPVENGSVMKSALEYASTHKLLLISHSEDKSLSGDGVVNEGYNATIAGLKGITRAAEEAAVARDVLLAGVTGARIHIAHVSTAKSVDIIRKAKSDGIKVTCETCPHYFAATDKEILNYNTNAKINPPLRTEKDRLAVIEGIKDGTIDVIATDHAPHHIDEKNVEFNYAAFGTTGLETAFAVSYTYLVKPGVIDIVKLSGLMSANPAGIIGADYGILEPGRAADITVIEDREYIADKNKFCSKSKNTLFDGWKLSGIIKHTFVNGTEKYKG